MHGRDARDAHPTGDGGVGYLSFFPLRFARIWSMRCWASGGWEGRSCLSVPMTTGPMEVSSPSALSRCFHSSALSSATSALIFCATLCAGCGCGWLYSDRSEIGTGTVKPELSWQRSVESWSWPLTMDESHSV